MPAFIETQFPIAPLSAGSYKERKANNGQTLTPLYTAAEVAFHARHQTLE